MEDRKAQDGNHVEVQDGSRLEEIGAFSKEDNKNDTMDYRGTQPQWIYLHHSSVSMASGTWWLQGCGAGKIVSVRTPGSLL